MFKCEVTRIIKNLAFQETEVYFEVSNKGNNKVPNHNIVGTKSNNYFIIGQVDRSIKIGDLIRCDGLPYMTKPVRTVKNRYNCDSNNRKAKVKEIYDLPNGYKPFQLYSGYWVLRRS